jgi:DNA-binding response OmpR family regulator
VLPDITNKKLNITITIFLIPMSSAVSKEQVLAKMQEFDVALQAANAAMQAMIAVRTELWSMISGLPDDEQFSKAEIPLTFYENGQSIAWGDDSEHFTPTTFELLRQMWGAASRTLSKEDIRVDVMCNEETSDDNLRAHIKNARRELESANFPYEIETIWGKGYRVIVSSQS